MQRTPKPNAESGTDTESTSQKDPTKLPAPTTTRRRALVAGAAAVAGGSILTLASRDANAAEITLGSLAIPDAEYASEDGELYAPWLRIDGRFTFDTEQAATAWRVYLIVTDGDGTRATIAEVTGDASGSQMDGDFTVSGEITDAPFYEPADFTVADVGAAKTLTIPVLVIFQVRSGSEVLAKDLLRAEPKLSIRHSEPPALAGGDGRWGFQPDETATPPFTQTDG